MATMRLNVRLLDCKIPRVGARERKIGLVALAIHALAHQLAIAPHGLGLLARAPLRRLLVIAAQLHLAENSFALHLLLENAQRLIDIVVTDENLHGPFSLLS